MRRAIALDCKAAKLIPLAGILVPDQHALELGRHVGYEAMIDSVLVSAAQQIKAERFDFVYTANSMPRPYATYRTRSALCRMRLSAGHIVEIGDNCTSVLDALFLCSSAYPMGSTGLIACFDAFHSDFEFPPNEPQWMDGAAVLLIGESKRYMQINAYVVANDVDLVSSISIDGRKVRIQRDEVFMATDGHAEVEVANQALLAAGISWEQVDGYIVVNRSEARLEELAKIIPIERGTIFHSRSTGGHKGAADLLINLYSALARFDEKRSLRLLLIGNGLGYTWSAMQVNVTQRD